MDDFKRNYDAVLVAVGISEPSTLDMFKDNSYAVPAVSFLKEVKDKAGEVKLPESAIVIGGGDSAMDAATTLKILGVPSVTCVTRKELANFRASKEELQIARDEGVTIIDGYAPVSVDGNKVVFKHGKLNNELKLEADKIVLAVGQHSIADKLGISMDKNEVGFVGYQANGKVFVTGDIAKGDKTVVYAVLKGKEAAAAIDSYLGGK